MVSATCLRAIGDRHKAPYAVKSIVYLKYASLSAVCWLSSYGVQKAFQMSSRYFCTLFDRNYLLKGVAMLRSLKKHCPTAIVHVLCMDEDTRQIIERLSMSDVHCLSLPELETDEILKAKADRGVAEYCWTLSSCVTWYVLNQNPEIDFITYLDADLLFYSPIEPLFDEIGASSIAIIEHRFSDRMKSYEVNGRFCVEWVSFRRDEQGLACLSRWRQQCIEWCYYRLEDGKMGDQKYLDEWPDRYRGVHILQHPGAGIAPWNYVRYRFERDNSGGITVDGSPLVFYHFHQFQLLENGRFDRISDFYASEKKEPEDIYSDYEAQLDDVVRDVRSIVPGFSCGMKPAAIFQPRRLAHRYLPKWTKDFVKRFRRL